MALANYTDLKAAVGNWLNRGDLTAQIPDFITLAEKQIARRLRRTVTKSSVSVSTAATTLPAAVAELRSVRLITGSPALDLPLKMVSKPVLDEHASRFTSTGRPYYGAIVGTTLEVAPAPDSSYTAELTYFASLTPLSDGAPTNTVLTEAPDLYLFGALKEASPYIAFDERIPVWTAKFEESLQQMNEARAREEESALRDTRAILADRPTSLASYDDLRSAIAAWLDRPNLIGQVRDFITLAERQIARRVRRTTEKTSITISAESTTLPASVAELRSIRLVTSSPEADLPLKIVSKAVLDEHRTRHTAAGRPYYACIIGSDVLVAPTPLSAYTAEITYFPALVSIGPSVASNSILVEAPDLYLYGALKEAAPYLAEDGRIAVWSAKFEEALEQLNGLRQRQEELAMRDTRAMLADRPTSLENYDDLRSAVASWLDRPDLIGHVRDFITLAEKQIARRLRRTSVKATVTFAAGSDYTLPEDCAELRSVRLSSGSPSQDAPLYIGTKEMLDEQTASRAAVAGRPVRGAVVGNTLLLSPLPSEDLTAEIVYFSRPTPLSIGQPSNSVLTEAPDLYLFGALKEAAPYLGEDKRIEMWTAKFEKALVEMNDMRQNEEMGASLRPMRSSRVF